VALVGLAGCAGGDEGTAPPPPPPPPPAFLLWSDPNTWPSKAVPAAGAAVVVPASTTIRLDVSPPALRSLTIDGTLEFADRDLTLTSDWIVVHGTLRIGTEEQRFTKRATITLTGPSTDAIEGAGAKVLAVIGGTLDLHGRSRTTWTKLTATAGAGANQLTVAGPIDWEIGDRIVIASTDFDPLQAEEGILTAVQGSLMTLQAGLRWAHWGQSQMYAGKAVDERAEVGLLSRNIVIQGDDASLTSGFGGHLMVMQGGVARVEGVELTRMGQKRQLARYPMHWHLSGNVDGQYFRQNAVWKTFNRCLTIHGTNNLQVTGNVCYDNIGHAYFLEDGAETGNLLEGNLGLATRRPATGEAVLPSDVDPATYWITNPDNTYRRNVAAGSRGFGFWFALPESPTGLSIGHPAKPRSTPLREFTDNVAHSNSNTGLNVDHGPKLDGTTETVHYAPRQIPGNNNSPLVTAYFRNFTGYKHAGRAVWLRGSELRLVGATLADNHIGGTFASNETFIQDGLVVGPSANSATPFARNFPVRGYEFYDGRVGAERVTFVNFQPTANNYMSALGYNRKNGFPINTGNYAKQLTFVNSNQVFLENPDPAKDGDKAAVAYDVDGSLTGTAGAWVTANSPLLTTTGCVFRAAWNASVCQQRFVNLQVRSADQGQAVAPLTVTRDDAAATTFAGVPGAAWFVSASVVPGRGYSVAFQGPVPSSPQVFANELIATDWIRVSFPYPTGAINVYRDYNTSASIAAAATLAELDGSTGDKYFYDAGPGVLHLKAMAKSNRTWAALFVVRK
jgi:cell migration-inducing and hyaluronan-binding protein